MKNIVLLFLFLVPVFLFAQYPTQGNKSRLGYQTTGDGLIWRGVAADTVIKPRTTANAYFQLDTVNRVLRRYIATQGSWQVVAVTPNLTPYALKAYVDSLYATDHDRDSTNELQTLTFASPLLGISDGNNVNLSDLLIGYVTGSGTNNRVPKWSALTNLTDSNIQDNGTVVSILSSKPFALGQWTTAGRPTGVDGYLGRNTSTGFDEGYFTSQWENYITSTGASANEVSYFTSAGKIAGNTRHTINATSGSQTITFNNTSSGSTDYYFNATSPLASGINTWGMRYYNNNQLIWGHLNGGAHLWFTGSGSQGELRGTWRIVGGTSYQSPANLASTGASSNDVRLVVQKSGDGANRHVHLYTQRYAVADNAPSILTSGTSHLWNPRNTTTAWNVAADTAKMFLAQNGDLRLYSAAVFTAPTVQARLNVIGRGTATTYPLLLLENLGGTDRFAVLENGKVSIAKTSPDYIFDVTSTDAYGLPRGTVAQQPTIVASTTPFRFNTDSTALEYGESVGTWRQLATRAYARSLVAAADGNGIYSGSGSLAGNTVITSGNSNVDWDNVSGFNLISGARAGATSITSDVYSSIKQYVNLAKTKYLQKYNSFDSRALTVSSDPNFTDIFEWNTTGSTLYEWGNATIIDTANTVITYKQGGRYHPSFHDFVGNRVGSGSLHRLKPIFEFRQSLTGNGSAWSPFVTFRTSTDTLFQIKKNGAIDAHQYGVGALEASDLSKTQSNYIAGFATDGTVLDLNVDTLLKKEKYYTITSTSSPQTLSNNFSDNLINQGGTQATFTLNMPASPEDGQVCTITYNNAISTLTIDGNGETIVGSAVVTAVPGSQRKFKFYTGIGWIKLY